MRAAIFVSGLLLLLAAGPALSHGQAPEDSTYTVESGDTLYDIARRYGVSVQALMDWNDLDSTTLQEGQTLRIRPPQEPAPAPSDPPAAESDSIPEPAADTTDASPETPQAEPDTVRKLGSHVVEDGTSFVSLALRLGTTADSLFVLNDRRTAPLSPGDTVRIPPRFAPPTHVVEPGETLYSIAGEYGVSVRTLRTANDLDTTEIDPGRRLHLPERLARPVPPPGEWASPDTTGPVSVFPGPFAGRLTASGQPYDPEDLVISHPSLPYGSVVLLSSSEPPRHVFARVVDRASPDEGTLIEISAAVAEQLGHDSDASFSVALRTVWVAEVTDRRSP